MSTSGDLTPAASILFTRVSIGPAVIPNRFVRSATHDFMAEDDGSITDRQVALFSSLAEGEVGLIITGHAFVNPGGKASPRQIGIHEDRLVPGLARLTAEVHRFPSRILVQLAHAGRQTKEKLCGGRPIAPSPVFEPVFKVLPREMAEEDIVRTIDDFIRGGVRARTAGFDGVQIHAAHGYLLSSFLSPHTNRRSDAWGGPIQNRARIVSEIIRGIKAAAGADFPVAVKLNSSDLMPGGLDIETAVEAARLFVSDGLDAIEVSGGTSESGRGSMWPGVRPEEEEGYFVDAAARVKGAVRIPVLGLGGLRTFREMEKFVREGRADLVSMSRPFIREPGLVRLFREGKIKKSECISCNKCFNPRGIACGDLAVRARRAAAET
jgi:2,4-dienoyl-CoA reductase-like NADH-dependent reductase (Old Yellow Enzyme family)